MRQFLFILLILPLFTFGQRQLKVTLELSTGDCRKNEHVRIGFPDTIRFYKSGNLFKQIIPMNYSEWPIEIENFNSGEYIVTYKNLYGQKTTKTIVIQDVSEYELQLCPDKLDAYSKNTLATLQDGESVKVNFNSQGCFHSVQEILTVTKNGDVLSATLQYNGKSKSVTLKSSQIEAFKRFENELTAVENGGGCTTTDTYIFLSKTVTINKIDGGCSWNGFYYLTNSFFGKLD